MSISYNWVISEIEFVPFHEGQHNVVCAVHWRRRAVDENGNEADAYGLQGIEFNPSDQFISFEDLTKDNVESWLEGAIGIDQISMIDAGLAKQISNKNNITEVVVSPPWI